MTKRLVVHHTVFSPRIRHALDLAVVSDLHDGPYEENLPLLRSADAILVVGDLVERHSGRWKRAAAFLKDAPRCAPTFYAIGNHERKFGRLDLYWPHVEQSDAVLLDDRFVRFRGIVLGGLSSGARQERVRAELVEEMAAQPGFKLLLCHHPEYYPRYIQGRGIDLTLSGHAHGGQVRLFGRGLYAPDQGVLPRLTAGFYDEGRLLVSRGMTNSNGLPRWGNPCELIMLHLKPEEDKR